MPTHRGFWTHDDQGLFPLGPESLRKNPEELIERINPRPGTLALENRELLSESQVFEQEIPTRTEKANNRRQKESNYA
jgi:hypothetical protein